MNCSASILLLALLLVTSVQLAPAKGETKNKLVATFESLHAEVSAEKDNEKEESVDSETKKSKLKKATFGTGCFWCTEAVFEELKGVKRVVSGYSGGRVPNPTYQQVLTGLTGHAEVIHLQYDPAVITYAKLLEVFWRTHDPTTKNRQGPDVGTQYRSAIFFHDDEQKELAKRFRSELNRAHAFRKPIVTEITRFNDFYPAKAYHQDYFARNGRAPYCRQVIRPKLSKFRRVFADQLERNKRVSTQE